MRHLPKKKFPNITIALFSLSFLLYNVASLAEEHSTFEGLRAMILHVFNASRLFFKPSQSLFATHRVFLARFVAYIEAYIQSFFEELMLY